MFKEIEKKYCECGAGERENRCSSNSCTADQARTISNVISLADEKKKQQRELLFAKLRKDGFLE